jgi:ubiquitin-activating enzyme E1
MPDLVSFKNFQDSLLFPTFDEGLSRPDVMKSDRVGQLHFAYHAVMEYRRKYQSLPTESDVEALFLISSKLNAEAKEEEERFNVEAINKDLITAVAGFANTRFRPVISVISGITALEVIKFTGKFMPIRQWFHYDCFDSLQGIPPSPVLDLGNSSRNWHTLVVGAGAVGCELLSLLQSLEIGTGTGSISVVDDGVVSYPILCTHSLFREEDVGRKKAETVAEALKRRNPGYNISGITCPIEDPQLSDQFWESKDLIICTVDSENSIKLTESKAIWYEKPSLFAFMSSTSAHISSLLPLKTGPLEFFPDEETRADATLLSSFPCRTSMCVEWAIQQFSHLFYELPMQARKYMDNPQVFIAELCNETLPSARLARFELLRDFFEVLVSTDPAASVVFARRRFEQLFTTNIRKLLEEHPLDQETEDGKMFWSGRKLPPEPTAFNANEDLHFNYLETCANLISQTVGRTLGLNKLEVKKIANQGLKSRAEAQTSSAGFDELQGSIDALCPQASKDAIHPLTYVKDDPSGTQLEYIVSASHIRCGNYKIEPLERLKIKQMAGGLQPSLPAMSSFVAGLAAAEILKLAAGLDIDQLKEIKANLAGPELALTELRAAPSIKPVHSMYEESAVLIPPKFTLWNKIKIQGPMTISHLKDKLESDYSIHILIIYSGSVVLYNVVNAGHEVQSDLYAFYQAKTQTASTNLKYLALKIEARTLADDRNAVLPVVKYAL